MSTTLFQGDILFLQRLLKTQGLYLGRLDGKWGPKTDAANEEFAAQTAAIAAAMGTFDARSESNIRTLALKAQQGARGCLAALADEALGPNIVVRVLSGTRTYEEQNALFRQGRFGNPGPIITKSRGGQSNHNFGIAWDLGIFDKGKYLGDSPLYETAGPIVLAATFGVEWGGNWTTFVDRPHYQMVTNLETAEVRARFEAGKPYLPA
jgi:peptidoglycan L-alanyl-D-glutamate endopeptidase CwlK